MDNFTLYFRELIETAKSLKSDIIYIFGDNIYGTDSCFTYLKHMRFENILGINICYEQKQMNDFIKVSTFDIVLNNDYVISNTESIKINNETYIKNILYLDKKINEMVLSNNNTLSIDNVRGDNQFEYAISLKAEKGIGLYKINEEYILSIFKSLLPINKSDKVSLTIYDIDETKFLTRFILSKPKNKIITISIMYLKIK